MLTKLLTKLGLIVPLKDEQVGQGITLEDKDNQTRQDFNRILEFARSFSSYKDETFTHDKNPYKSLIKAFINQINSESIISPILGKERLSKTRGFFDSGRPSVYIDLLEHFPIRELGKSTMDFIVEQDQEIKLTTDSVLSDPWHYERLEHAFVRHSVQAWKFDEGNHFLDYFKPLGIAYFNNGKHSGAMGILNQEGIIPPNKDIENVTTYDLTPLFDLAYTDGVNYYSKDTSTILKRSNSFELSVIFEISRLMHEHLGPK